MSEPTLPPAQANAAQIILQVMAAAPVPFAVHQQGREALALLVQALAPKPPEQAPPQTGPELVA